MRHGELADAIPRGLRGLDRLDLHSRRFDFEREPLLREGAALLLEEQAARTAADEQSDLNDETTDDDPATGHGRIFHKLGQKIGGHGWRHFFKRGG